ncbi:MAG: hypothetical protein LBG75_02450 [Candidatus Nomurabacteria bacterium]|jgi:hypothetical protein|nr:hypothetical protein [Candidatus Nomurabacteria bacterium]
MTKKQIKNQIDSMGDSLDIENDASFDFVIPATTNVPNIARTKADGQKILKLIKDYTEMPIENDGRFMTEKDLHDTMLEAT